jgi:HSP90 family molecular chaperone
METIRSHYPDASEIEEESSWNGFDSVMKFGLNRQNSEKHSIAPLSSYASPESDGQQKTIHLIRYMVSLWANLIEGQNMKTIKKGNLEYVQPLSGERSF